MSVLVSGGSSSNPGFTFNGGLTDGLYRSTPGGDDQDGIGHAISSNGKVVVGGSTLYFTANAGMAYQAPLNDDDHVPVSPAAGDLYFNTSSKVFKVYDGSGWNSLLLVDSPSYGNGYGFVVFGENSFIYDPMNGSDETLDTDRIVKLVNGNSSSPAYSFEASSNSGMFYNPGDPSFGFSLGGLSVMSISASLIYISYSEFYCSETFELNGTSQLFLSDGTAANPSYQLAAGIGFFHDGDNGVCGSIGSARAFKISSYGSIFDTDFHVSGYAFEVRPGAAPPVVLDIPGEGYAAVHADGDSNTGIYFDADSGLGIICGGSKVLEIVADGTVKADELTIGNSSSKYLSLTGSVDMSFLDDPPSSPDPAIYFGGATGVGISVWDYDEDDYVLTFSHSTAEDYCVGLVEGALSTGISGTISWYANSLSINTVVADNGLVLSAIYFPSLSSGTISSYLTLYSGNVLVYESSSIRYKCNVRNLDIDVKSIFNLTPVSFTYTKSSRRSFGFIAEDAEAFAPWAIARDKEGRIDSFKYKTMIVPVIFAVQDFIRRGDELSRRLVFTPGAEPFDPSRAVVSLLELKKSRESSDSKIVRLHARNKHLRERIGALKSLLVSQGR